MSVLIAEDDSVTRFLLGDVLRKNGYEVIETVDGAEAWEAMRQPDAPSLAILDWMMPEMDGLEVVRRIRSLPTDCPPYLIMLTIKDEKSDIIEALKAGANEFISKPFHLGELLARVEAGRKLVEIQSALASRNERLRQLHEKLYASRSRYHKLYDQAPVGYLAVSEAGLIHEANHTAGTMLGVSRRDLLNRPVSSIIHREDAESFESLCKQLLAMARPLGGGTGQSAVDLLRYQLQKCEATKSCELKMEKADGTVFWASVVANVAQDEDGAPVLHIVLNDVTGRKMAEEERNRHALTTTRRFLSVLVLELKYLGSAVQRLKPDEIQTGFDLFWNSFYRFVTDEGGLPLPPQSQEFIAIFGVETFCVDHAVKATNAAAAISTWLSERSGNFSQSGLEIPHFSIALHCGETVAMRIPGGETLPWVVLGEAVNFTRTLIRVCRADEVICSESFVSSFLDGLPDGQEFEKVAGKEEFDLDGLNWEVANFVPLEESFRNRSILVGPQVRARPGSATVRFNYLYAFSCGSSGARTRVVSVVFPNVIPRVVDAPAGPGSESPDRWMGKYRLLKILGQGGMGTVWLGQDCFKNCAAIKVLLDPASAGNGQGARFEREARVMTQLSHRNICRIFEVSENDGTRYIAMEFVNGPTLAELLANVPEHPESHAGSSSKRNKAEMGGLKDLVRRIHEKNQSKEPGGKRGPGAPPAPVLTLDQSLPLFLKICDAIQYAHEKGVLHRDLKPENILIREDGDPVVFDFGLAKLWRESNAGNTSHIGQIIGTLAFMAPEQLDLNAALDERSDVFSLGAILYSMLAGNAQFRASENFVGALHALESHKPLPPSYHRKSIPKDLEMIVMKSLSRDPAARYQSVQALSDDIARFLDGEPVRIPSPSIFWIAEQSYRRHRTNANAIACSLLFAIAVSMFAFWSISREKTEAVNAVRKAEIAGPNGARSR